jgi:hypothetical protein
MGGGDSSCVFRKVTLRRLSGHDSEKDVTEIKRGGGHAEDRGVEDQKGKMLRAMNRPPHCQNHQRIRGGESAVLGSHQLTLLLIV